jgi:hypothetical protein
MARRVRGATREPERRGEFVQLPPVRVRLLVRVEPPPRGLQPERVADGLADVAGQLPDVAIVPERDGEIGRHIAQDREESLPRVHHRDRTPPIALAG